MQLKNDIRVSAKDEQNRHGVNYLRAILKLAICTAYNMFERIRLLSQIDKDGTKIVQHVFGGDPILVINAYHTKQEVEEQKGFQAILEGLCNMFRNPEAHQPFFLSLLKGVILPAVL